MRRFYSRAVRRCRTGWERLYYRVARRTPAGPEPFAQRRYLPGGGDPAGLARLHKELFPGSAERRMLQADLICDHVFDLLGGGPVRLSSGGPGYQPLDWHRDFKSGHRWDPDAFYRDIRYGHIKGVEVKTPWELSRFQHFGALAQAHVLTGHPKYRTEFVNQIDDWIRSNPVGFGVNWACTMDAAIRAANWLVWAECFLADGCLDRPFLGRFYASIREHGRFIRSHLERSDEGTANHYLADIVALLFIAVYCPFFRESPGWRRFCTEELIREMNGQVYPDGCHFEASTCYHRLALELFFFATLLVAADERGSDDEGLRAAQSVFGPGYMAKLHAMFVAILHLLKPSGRMPQIGDNDSGRFLAFGAREVLDMRYLLALGAVFFQEPRFKVREFGFAEEALWVFGGRGYDTWNRLAGRSVATIGGRAFPDAGWYVIRQHPDYCLVSCGPNGANGRGGHAHNDKLSIELVLDGRDVIVDPGTYVYTSDPDQRNRFRTTDSHNTVAVDGCEQAELPADLFRLPDRVRIRRAEFAEDAEWAGFAGAIEYAGIEHARVVGVDKASGSWSIEDRVWSPRPIGGKIAFHLAPGMTSHGRSILDQDGKTPVVCIEIGDAPVETGTYRYSPEYGVAVQARSLSVRIPDLTNATIKTVFSREHPDAGTSVESRGRLPARRPAPVECRLHADHSESQEMSR